MKTQNLFRVVATALLLSTLSFAAGVAGDLSLADGPRSGERVVLRIPPQLPPETVRATPLPLISTPAAAARPIIQPARAERIEPILAAEKPPHLETVGQLPKVNLDLAPKAGGAGEVLQAAASPQQCL